MALATKATKVRGKSASPLKAAQAKKKANARTPELAAPPSAPSASKYAVGLQVSHPMFGDGTVTAIDADKLTIKFARGVVKEIVDYYVKPRKP